MKGLLRKLEDVYAAAAFAEAGEFETARELLRDEERAQVRDRKQESDRPRKQMKAPGIKR